MNKNGDRKLRSPFGIGRLRWARGVTNAASGGDASGGASPNGGDASPSDDDANDRVHANAPALA